MLYEVPLPDLGDDFLEQATVTLWHVKQGDIVHEGDDLVEMATDKASFTVPSPKTGRLVELLVEEDQEVKVDQVLCVLEVI